jgi:alanyl-tRNA synthetase
VVVLATNAAARGAGLRAGALVKLASGILGGGGGGKDDMAQGGGADPSKLSEAFAAVRREVGA